MALVSPGVEVKVQDDSVYVVRIAEVVCPSSSFPLALKRLQLMVQILPA